jgi:hypothetical protein
MRSHQRRCQLGRLGSRFAWALLSGCMSLTAGGNRVQVRPSVESVNGCEFLGEIRAASLVYGEPGRGRAEAELRNRAAELGGNAVRITEEKKTRHAKGESSELIGDAFRCRTPYAGAPAPADVHSSRNAARTELDWEVITVWRTNTGVGINVADITPALRQRFNLRDEKGIVIIEAAAGGPAAQAGLRAGDVVRSCNGKLLGRARAFADGLRALPVDAPIELEVTRRPERRLNPEMQVSRRLALAQPARAFVFDLKRTGDVSEHVPVMVTKLLVSHLDNVSGFDVVTQADIAASVQSERQKDLLGCDDTTCLAELGGALGVALMVYGDLGLLGSQYGLNVAVLDTKKGIVLARVSVMFPANDDRLPREILAVVEQIVDRMNRQATSHSPATEHGTTPADVR